MCLASDTSFFLLLERTFSTVTPKFSETPGSTRWLGPDLGEHNHEVLRALGYADAEITELKNNGVI